MLFWCNLALFGELSSSAAGGRRRKSRGGPGGAGKDHPAAAAATGGEKATCGETRNQTNCWGFLRLPVLWHLCSHSNQYLGIFACMCIRPLFFI